MPHGSATEINLATLAVRVGARMRILRIDADLTQEQLAKRLGSHRPIIGRIERGAHVPTLPVILAWARAVDAHPRDILNAVDALG